MINEIRDRFRVSYRTWVEAASSVSLLDMGFRDSNTTLIDVLAQQGFKGGSKSGNVRFKSKSCEFYDILERANEGNFDQSCVDDLRFILAVLQSIEYTKEWSYLNPRNIVFEDPVRISRISLRVRGTAPVYGHYITPDYIRLWRYRAIRNENPPKRAWGEWEWRSRNEKVAVPTGVHEHFFSHREGEARPPLWQALFGDGTEIPFKSQGLLPMLEHVFQIPKQASKENRSLSGSGKEWPHNPKFDLKIKQTRIKDLNRYYGAYLKKNRSREYGSIDWNEVRSLRVHTSANDYPMFLPFSSLIRGYFDSYENVETRDRCSYCRGRGHQIRSCPHRLKKVDHLINEGEITKFCDEIDAEIDEWLSKVGSLSFSWRQVPDGILDYYSLQKSLWNVMFYKYKLKHYAERTAAGEDPQAVLDHLSLNRDMAPLEDEEQIKDEAKKWHISSRKQNFIDIGYEIGLHKTDFYDRYPHSQKGVKMLITAYNSLWKTIDRSELPVPLTLRQRRRNFLDNWSVLDS